MSECSFQENRLLEVLLLSELTLHGPFSRNKDITAKEMSYDLKATNMSQVLQLEAPGPPITADCQPTYTVSGESVLFFRFWKYQKKMLTG
ncbi:hypothetical protein BPAE_0008g00490 [Botrytis paeoniae]|uniref:Uncharacterized protein n=1 Tax=Botrytis paeoniae TaxID=278948 RepID=A0A4Z1G7R3_9HELO|nr:hypothetical protein BPAE_0008g00490 [Botrytis paeoniae]